MEARFPNKGAGLVVGCKSGRRSTLACEQLAAAGYTDLVNMSGGFDAWLAAGFPKAGGTPAAAQLVRISTQEGQGLIEKGATYLDVR